MKRNSEIIRLLIGWYEEQCNGEWEREHGVRIDSLGDPGWDVEIDLRGTEAESLALAWRIIERSELDWVGWKIEDGKFFGGGGIYNLYEIVELFLSVVDPESCRWKDMEALVPGTSKGPEVNGKTEVVKLLLDWYQEQCDDEAWEEGPGIRVRSSANPGWIVEIELEGTKGEDLEVVPIQRIVRSELDWVQWKIEDAKFASWGGVKNLVEIIEIFLSVVDPERLSQQSRN